MTQRRAVYVGCRLIAVYLVIDAAAAMTGGMMSLGWMATMTGNTRFGGNGLPAEYLIQTMVIPSVARAGIAVFLWALAGMISRAAANPEDADDL